MNKQFINKQKLPEVGACPSRVIPESKAKLRERIEKAARARSLEGYDLLGLFSNPSKIATK